MGTGCPACKALYETTREAVAELKMEAVVIKEEDMEAIMSWRVMRLPALVVGEKLVSSGKKLSVAEVKELLTGCY